MKTVIWSFIAALALAVGIPLFLWDPLDIKVGIGRREAASNRLVKEFSIDVAETEHELYPGGPKIMAWAFNGQVPGPHPARHRRRLGADPLH